ncbi:hypothetical protein PoB_005985400 [Plakobranchus ocellatus]|uniref:Uncharacterized protein n=1 Tax=Plakobranchus ocellatus TaxID=259542 RepID=A0AAV4CKF4_9GAST|nr:hypothetical protein PoB_005985400 [Plakobranchus ocellatus]
MKTVIASLWMKKSGRKGRGRKGAEHEVFQCLKVNYYRLSAGVTNITKFCDWAVSSDTNSFCAHISSSIILHSVNANACSAK